MLISNDAIYSVAPPPVKTINISEKMPNLLQNLGFFQGLKVLSELVNLDKRTPTVDFSRDIVLDSSK